MQIGLIIVGDEILSGRRSDQHLPSVVDMLRRRGLVLSWVRIVGDDPVLLEQTFRETLAGTDLVFSTGGIGATPDDLTREAVARALGIATEVHPQGLDILRQYCRDQRRDLNPDRLRLIEFPAGARLIPNPVNTIPGFSIGHHHFVPGFPQMAWPMLAWVLDTLYPGLTDSQYREEAIMVFDTYESAIIPVMETLLKAYPATRIFSLPMLGQPTPQIEMGVKGPAIDVSAAMEALKQALNQLGSRWERLDRLSSGQTINP